MQKILFYLIFIVSIFLLVTSFKFLPKDLKYTDAPKEVEVAFEKALKFADENLDKKEFKHQFKSFPADTTEQIVKVDLNYGKLFSDSSTYLIVSCEVSLARGFYRIYIEENKKFNLIIEQTELSYVGENSTFLKDINGDNKIDFVIPYSSPSGCCPRQSEIIFLYKDKNFIRYNFLNPTFSPKEQLVRGLGYGYFPEVGLYKYKWNGTQLDTVEYIYRTKESNFKKYIRMKRPMHSKNKNKGEILDSLPTEYQNIDGIDWFLKN